jgi:hypothetical protein
MARLRAWPARLRAWPARAQPARLARLATGPPARLARLRAWPARAPGPPAQPARDEARATLFPLASLTPLVTAIRGGGLRLCTADVAMPALTGHTH